MTVFDTDLASDLLQGRPAVAARAAAIPPPDQAITIVTVEEMLRGRLARVRQAATGTAAGPLVEAYALLGRTAEQSQLLRVLPYTDAAHALFAAWRAMKVRVGTQDLRIAAICVAHGATLATRNARDFAQVPGLALDV